MATATAKWRSTHVRESQYFTQIMKCDDRRCCRIPRSSYFTLFPARFLPPPVPLHQTSDGLKAPDISKQADTKFHSVFLTNTVLPPVLPRSAAAFMLLPYDAYCPSLHSLLPRRMCRKCGLYHASLTSLRDHLRTCGVNDTGQTVRPVRVAARRQRKLMAIIAYQDMEDAEWLDEDFVDFTG